MPYRPLLRWLALATLVSSTPVLAALGGTLDSVTRDRLQVKASARVIGSGPALTVHELILPSGTTVHEFANADQRVFAVSWSGPAIPDLRQFLGAYFAQYASADRSSTHGHSHRAVQRDDLVVRSTGRPRAFTGMAYVPSLVPKGVSIDALQ